MAEFNNSNSKPEAGDLSTVRIDVDALIRDKTPGELNNDPDAPLEPQSLEIDNLVTARLTQKPHDKYKFRKSIGRGGMKMVLQVKDVDTTRDVAMAVLPDAMARPRKDTLRFVQEARITATLEHPNIVPVHDIGVDSTGAPYFTMKLLRGETLASLLEKLAGGDPEYHEAYNLERLLRIFLKVCYAVAFAHSKGVIHLDLKPENIQIGDFGEVLVMDWGLARIISGSNSDDYDFEDEQESTPGALKDPAYATVDGVMKGTPGYMAPEQAAGKNSQKDCRTDIYALGAILYSMATLKNPIGNKSVREMIRDTLQGNIVPPKNRVPEREIPSALEAVIMKAMSLNPDQRYQSVQDLRSEVFAFIGGFATKAERATTLKRFLLFCKRHKIIVSLTSALTIILLFVGVYAIQEAMRLRGNWVCIYKQDFTAEDATLKGLTFWNSHNTKQVPDWELSSDGLVMPPGEWLWLDTKILGDTKVEVEIAPLPRGTTLEICVNSKIEPLEQWWFTPTGYVFQIGGFAGAHDVISHSYDPAHQELLISVDSGIASGRETRITFMKQEEQLTILFGNKIHLQTTDLFPPSGNDLDMIGLRAMSSTDSISLRSLAAYRLALPEKASPLIAGDTLVDVQLYDKAIEKYLAVADSYPNLPLSDMALTKAYMTAATKLPDSEYRLGQIVAIKRRISARPYFKYHEQIMEIDAIMLWREKRYDESLLFVNDIMELNANSGIVDKILQLPHHRLPENVVQRLLFFINKSENIKQLDISNYGVTSLVPIKNLNLTYLNCSGNRLETLAGIEDMSLDTLYCQNNSVTDLSPIAGMKLQILHCQDNGISDISLLASMPLRDLNISNNKISNLMSLKNSPIEALSCRNNRIASLDAVGKLPLRNLNAGKNPIQSLAPLKGMRLLSLSLDHTEISDISPLTGMPLRILELHNCTRLKDISPVLTLPNLERLSIPENAENIDALKASPTLKYLSCKSVNPFSLIPAETVNEFWEKFDSSQNGD